MKLLVNLCSYLGYGMLWGVSFLPLPVMYLMTDVLFVVLFYGVHYRRKVVDMNLREFFSRRRARRNESGSPGSIIAICVILLPSFINCGISRRTRSRDAVSW